MWNNFSLVETPERLCGLENITGASVDVVNHSKCVKLVRFIIFFWGGEVGVSYDFKTVRHLRDAGDSAPDGNFLSHLHQDLDDPRPPTLTIHHQAPRNRRGQERTGGRGVKPGGGAASSEVTRFFFL